MAPSMPGSVDMFPVAPSSPECSAGIGARDTHRPRPPRPSSDARAGSRHAASSEHGPQHQLGGHSKPCRAATLLSPCSPGPAGSPCGRLHHVQACVTRGAESGLRDVELEPTGARAGCAGWAGASPHQPSCEARTDAGQTGTSPGTYVGLGFPGTSCPARGRSGCGLGPGGPSQPQAGLVGCRGRGRLPQMVAEPRASQPPSCTFTLFLNLPLG